MRIKKPSLQERIARSASALAVKRGISYVEARNLLQQEHGKRVQQAALEGRVRNRMNYERFLARRANTRPIQYAGEKLPPSAFNRNPGPISLEKQHAIIKGYQEGASEEELAYRHGVHPAHVGLILINHGIPERREGRGRKRGRSVNHVEPPPHLALPEGMPEEDRVYVEGIWNDIARDRRASRSKRKLAAKYAAAFNRVLAT